MKLGLIKISLFVVAIGLSGCVTTGSTVANSTTPSLKPTGQILTGKASWYSVRTNGGTHTASGIPFKNSGRTAAHKTLPMGTWVRVTNLTNGKNVIVEITDRGPYIKGRIIDMSIGMAGPEYLDFVNTGVVPAKVEIMEMR